MDIEPIQITVAAPVQPRQDYAAKKQRILVWLLIWSAIMGAIAGLLTEDDLAIELLISLPWLCLCVYWCHVDAQERNFRLGRFMRLTLILIFLLGFPIYLFRSRGIKGGLTLMWSIAFWGITMICDAIGMTITASIAAAVGN